jgi:arsenate reductase (glutaredoxin)
MTVTIYHNPRCSKSRQTLALLEKLGTKPKVIEYLIAPPTADELKRILKMLKMSPRQLLRKREAAEAGLDDPKLTDDALIKKMIANPIVIERPIVVKGTKAVLGRPPESVLAIL